MTRWTLALAAIAGASLLASCGSSSSAIGAAGTAGTGATLPAAITPLKDCGGTGGVKVKPCPVHLNAHTKDGIVVTVKGPGVASSDLGRLTSCFNGLICYNAERYGSSEKKWLITPGSSCGSADVEFDAFDANGREVGYFFLKVANKYCP
jgi:hypothetical protein